MAEDNNPETTRKSQIEDLTQELTALREMQDMYTGINAQIEAASEIRSKSIELLKLEIRQMETLVSIEANKAKDARNQKAIDDAKAAILLRQEQIKSYSDEEAALDRVTNATNNLLVSVTGVDERWKSTFLGSIIAANDVEQSTFRIAQGLKTTLDPANMLGSAMLKIQESTLAVALAQDDATSGFAKATGTGSQYFNMITRVSEQNRLYGISAQDSAEATQLLYQNLNLFSGLPAASAAELTELVAQLDALGVSSETTVSNLDIAMRVLGMNTQEAKNLQKQLFATAQALQLPPQTVADGFAKIAPRLVAYGDQTIDVFQEIARQSKATGVEMERLVQIAATFDTFEGSAQFVADFNHLLGGAYLNSLELVNASDEERIELMQESFKQAGKSFDQMDRHTKIAIQQRLGFESVAEAARVLNPEMIGLTAEQKKARLESEAAAEQAKAAQSVYKEFQNAAASLAVGLQPLVHMLSEAASWFAKWNKSVEIGGGFTINIASAITILVAGLWSLFKIRGILLALTGKDLLFKKTDIALTKTQIASQKAAAQATKARAASMIGLGVAIALAGVGIAAAALGMAQFVKAFNGMPPESIYAVATAIGVLVVGLAAIVAVAMAAAGAGVGAAVLVAIGGAVALIGVGVGVAAAGMSLLVTSLVKGFDVISDNLGGFLAFVGALTVFSLLSPGLGMTFGVLVPGLGLMAAALAVIKTSDLQALGSLFQGISNITSETAEAMASVARSVGSIISDISRVNLEKLTELRKIMEAKVAAQAAGVEFADSAAGVSAAAVQRTQAGVQTTPKASGTATSQTQLQPVNITLKIDDREVARIAWKEIQKEMERVGNAKRRAPRLA